MIQMCDCKNRCERKFLDLIERCVLRVVVLDDRVVFASVVRNEERPASLATLIAVTPMQDIAMEEDGVTCENLRTHETRDVIKRGV